MGFIIFHLLFIWVLLIFSYKLLLKPIFIAERYVESTNCLHFLFKYRPMQARNDNNTYNSNNSSNISSLPTQYIESKMKFPLDEPNIQEK